MTQISQGNVGEAELWNTALGRIWVEHESDLDATSAPALSLLLERARLQPGARVLDIGCGAGASSLAAARAVGPKGAVEGLDISAPLLERARARAASEGFGNLVFTRGDAEVHDFAGQDFDAAISRFGVMFFSDPVAAFANIARALRAGASITFVAWASLAENPFFAVPREAAIRLLGPGAPAAPDAPGPMAFQDRDRVAGLMRGAGLRDVVAEAVKTDLTPRGDVGGVGHMLTRIGPAYRLLRERGGTAEDAAAIAAEVAQTFAPYATPQGVRIPATLNLFAATAP